MRLTLAGPTLKRCSNLFQTNLWQGSRLIAETDNDKHWQTYLYEPDSYRPLALVHGNAQQDNIKLYWYQNDHLGTPIALTSNIGDTLYECQYNAYGQIINETYYQDDFNALPDNPLRFQGQYYDEETGLHYNLNRYYDPFTGRYITQDPLGILGGLNSYQYADSDPINWIDPLGLIKVENNGFEGIAGKETTNNLLGKEIGEYSAMNPGPLTDDLAGTFSGGRYKEIVLEQDTILYRAGTADKPFGQFFSVESPQGILQTRIDKAVLPKWPGGGTSPIDSSIAVKIPAGTRVYVGEVGSQHGIYIGGTQQIVVPKSWAIKGTEIMEIKPLK
jgi:RHS repeat-associated protein